ncbi:MFS transporter [Kribbella sp. NPDC051718]|uniref:MFS transporter n=1 Tax=Kribbella sp. NPDC051718 TaxID=3155168 RepID=UPI0034199674
MRSTRSERAGDSSSAVRRLLAVQAFRYQFVARASSNIGTSIAPVALTLGILQLTGSAGALALVLSAHTVVFLAVVLVGGVWADRLPRHRMMQVADSARFLTQGVFAGLFFLDCRVLWPYIALQAVNGFATAFSQPAAAGLTRLTSPPDLLRQANALLASTRNVTSIAGPLVAGVIVVFAGPGPAFVLDALTFAISAVMLGRLTLPPMTHAGDRSVREDLAAGWQQVRARSWLLISLSFFGVENALFSTFLILAPLALGAASGDTHWAYLVSAMAAGQLAGNAVALRWPVGRPLLVGRLLCLLVLPLFAAVAAGLPLWSLTVLAVVTGAGTSVAEVLWMTTMQARIPSEVLARVSSYDLLLSLSARPIGYAGAGLLAAWLGSREAVTWLAIAVLVTIVGGLLPRSIRRDGLATERLASNQVAP